MKEIWFEWTWKWCFRSSIIRNRYFWNILIFLLSYCCIWKYVMIVHFHFISFLILDLPKLHTISFNGNSALYGDERANRQTMINGHESYDNTLIMKSKWNEMKCELCFDDCLDLPSLTQIKGNQNGIHRYMGYVILESMIWFDLIWFDLNRHSKSHWKQHSLWRIFINYTADL